MGRWNYAIGFFSRRSKPANGTTGWLNLFTGDLYDRRWFEQRRVTSRVQRNGIEMSDPVPVCLQLVDDAEEWKRFITRPPREPKPDVQAAHEYFEAKAASTAANLSFTVGAEHTLWIRRMVFTVLKYDGIMILDSFEAHPALRQQYSDRISSVSDDDVAYLLAWWLALAADDPAGQRNNVSVVTGLSFAAEPVGGLRR